MMMNTEMMRNNYKEDIRMKKREFIRLAMIGTVGYVIGRYTMKAEMLFDMCKFVIDNLKTDKDSNGEEK